MVGARAAATDGGFSIDWRSIRPRLLCTHTFCDEVRKADGIAPVYEERPWQGDEPVRRSLLCDPGREYFDRTQRRMSNAIDSAQVATAETA